MSTGLEALAWPTTRLAGAIVALAQKCKFSSARLNDSAAADANVDDWIESAAKHLACEADAVETNYRDLESDLAVSYPALLRVSEGLFLAIVTSRGGKLRVLTPNLSLRSVCIAQVCQVIREPLARADRSMYEALLAGTGISPSRQSEAVSVLVAEQLANKRFNQCWILHPSPAAPAVSWFRRTGALRNGSSLLVAHVLQYLLWLASWAILGRLSLEGRMDRGWLIAWALLLLTLVPLRVLSTWKQGLVAIGIGGFLKRRLLYGALRLNPEEMRHCGIGSFLAQAFEAETVESFALTGGIAGLLAVIELIVSAFILGRLAVLLLVWFIAALFVAWRFLRKFEIWTSTRFDLTQDLVESMAGNRTRLAQLPRGEWHESEDNALSDYLAVSRSLDRTGTALMAGLARGWLIAALACLAPAMVAARNSVTQTAISVGGILLAYTAFSRLADSVSELAGAIVSWKRIAPLFRAAARPEELGQLISCSETSDSGEPTRAIIEADRLTFRYRPQGNPALQACSLTVRSGDRILLEGPSGGGKTTFASLLCGMRQPESGLLLAGGLDRYTLGSERWHKSIAAAPQFHENHILTGTLAFNLLMGRRWPPTTADMDEAETLCRDLGLGGLVDNMPSGLLQMVGEGGWQLSHGERSRVFVARALLQRADLVILDESFAALDPENLRTALECTLARAETLMVIAHP